MSSTSKKISSAASKILASKTASKTEKAVAAAALTQTKALRETVPNVSLGATRILKDPKASKEAKSAAASALTQKVRSRKP